MPAGSCMPASTTRRSCARPSWRPTSSCGTAATTTSRSIARTSTSWWPTRCVPATSATTTRARPTCGWPTWSIINKIDSASAAGLDAVHASIRELNPTAAVISARSDLALVGATIEGKRVVVVEDGPTLTHGGMPYGAGVVAARRFGAAELVDPRPAAVGSIRDVLDRYPALEPLVPAMGYGAGADRRARGDAQRGRRRSRPVGDPDRPDPPGHAQQADHPRPLRAGTGRRPGAGRPHRADRARGATDRPCRSLTPCRP